MEKIRKLAGIILERHRSEFSTDYQKNKEALEDMAIIPSKQLRNQIAGYIAKALKVTNPTVEIEEIVEEAKAE